MEDRTNELREHVREALRTRSCMKQDIFTRTIQMFTELGSVLEEVATELQAHVRSVDPRLHVSFDRRSETACELRVAGDVVAFSMHTNVFRLERAHHLWQTSYLQEDAARGYFGMLNMYNFLSDSMLYNRERDLGYLVARLFLNHEGHFFVQGKHRLGSMYNNLAGAVLDRRVLKEMVYAVVDHVIGFDLLVPPYDEVSQVSVGEMRMLYATHQVSTGKRLGFRFQADLDEIS